MRVLGSYMVGSLEQKLLKDGMLWDLPRDHIMSKIVARAAVGDLLWLKEPFWLITSRRHGPQNICEVVPGPVMGTRKPARLAKILDQLRQQRRSALVLERPDSRITLEIAAIGERAISMRVHFRQIDAFLRERPAA